ncbi:MAG: hypothetical protein QOD83_2719 [Solirubrobacteraceae bacterium]|jgi:transcriptional regulator with XRE-family HTH domain|nr:hypothetical protein [Solirubrobacteraceae bacterium]
MDDPADASISNHERPEAQFGAELRSARENADLSLRALARILHRAHSSLVEYERGHRLAPVDIVREYESALGLKPDTLVALRTKAHAQRRTLGRDGDLPDASHPVQTPSDPMTATTPSGVPGDDAQAPGHSARAGDRARRRIRLRPLAVAAAAVALTAVVVVLGFDIADPGGTPMPGTASAPTQRRASPQVTIGAPPNYKVQRCTQWNGTARLALDDALVLGVRNLDNGDVNTYFATVVSWSVAPGQGDWTRPLFFGNAGAIGQQFAVTPMTVSQAAVDAVPNKDDLTTWSAEYPPRTAKVVKTVYVRRRAGPGDC